MYIETYVGRGRLTDALVKCDDFESVFELVGIANKIKEWRVEEIYQGVYRAIERAFKRK